MKLHETVGFIATIVALMGLAIVFMAITGCSGKNIVVLLDPTPVVDEGHRYTVVCQASSMDYQMAVDNAAFRCREKLGEYLGVKTLYNTPIIAQPVVREGNIYIATVKIAMNK